MNLFNRQTFFAAVVAVLCSLNPPPAQAIRPVDESVLPPRASANGVESKLLQSFVGDELDVQPSQESSANLVAQIAKPGVASFLQRAGGTWDVTWDRRNDRPNLIQGSGYPLVPGTGNNLSLPQLGLAKASDVDLAAIEMVLEEFIQQNAELLGARGMEFRFDRESSGSYGKDNSHWFVEFEQFHNGVPVEGAHLFFRIVAGNIVQFGTEKVAPVLIDTTPADEGIEALIKAMPEMFPADAQIVQYYNVPELLLAPVLPEGETVKELFHGAAGTGYAHKLMWRYVFRLEGDRATYEVLTDAHTNRVINVRDINRYIDARVSGGIYPTTNTDPIINVPFPYVSVTNGGTKITNLLGIYDWNGTAAGNATLNGQYFRMVDTCGSISLSSNTSDGNIAFGASGGTDCTTPGFGGAGNTHSSRTGFYHLTNINRKAIKYLSGHASSATWLNGKVTANMNVVDTCNAYWDGSTVNFFRSGGGCSNTGELAAVFLHEWGHGMDTKSGGSASEYGSGEAVGDTFAFLETKDSCIGMNFLPTNCDNCSACTGVRDVGEFSLSGATHGGGTHVIARPSTVADNNGINCDAFACPYTTSTGVAYRGPMGYEGHCESYIASSANWDLTQALIDTYGPSQGWQEMDRIWYGSLVASKSAYQVASGGTCNVNATVNGCGASNWYTVFLAADDNDGNLANGTPNACRIWDAFNAHGIACGTRPTCSSITDFTLDIPQTSQSVCRPDSATYTVNVASLGGFSNAVSLATTGLPSGITASFSPATVSPGNSSTLTVTAGAGVDAFPYTINVEGTAAGSSGRTVTTQVVVNEPLAPVALAAPADYSVNVSTSTSLVWAPANNVTGYLVQVATDPAFSNIVWSQTVTTPMAKPAGLVNSTRYYWKVTAQNVCGDAASTVSTFVTSGQASVLLVDDSHGGGTIDKWTTPLNAILGAGSYNIRDASSQGEPASAAELAPYKTIVWFSGGVYGGVGSYVAGPNPTSETLLGNWLNGGACYLISSQDYRYDRGLDSSFMTNYLGATVAAQDVSATSQTGLNIYSGVNANISASTAGFQLYPDQLTVEAGAQSAYGYNTTAIDGVSKSVGGANPYFTTWLAFPLEGSSVGNRQAVLQRFFDTCTYKSNKLPVAVNDAISVAQGGTATTLVGGATSVRANDTDAEDTVPGGDVTAYRLPANGTLTLNADGTFSYVHNGSATTSDSFTYYVKDSVGGISNAATVNITITAAPVNQPPTANSQNVSTAFNTPVAITLSGSDPDGDSLSYAIVTSPANGALSGVAPSLTYTPTTGHSGADSFTFTVSDGVATSAAATVSITVGAATSYTVTASVSGVGGTISPPSQNVTSGGSASFTVTPDSGYQVQAVTGDTCTVTQSGQTTTWTSNAITQACAVTATFAPGTSSGFTPGNVVVYRVGDGAGTLASGVAAKVYLDEFDASTGALVQSIEMPTAAVGAQNACTAAGTASSEGFISRSADRAYIVGTCYDASPATTSVSSSSSASINRVVFRVGADTVPDTITALSDFSNGGSPRSAASVNGTGLWMGGAGSPNSTRYVAYDAVTPPTTSAQLNTLNARVAQIYDGQLYVSVAAAINAVGTGLPTSGTQASTQVLSVSGGSIYGYYFADLSETEAGLDTLYVAQDNGNALGKYSKVGGVWMQNTPAIGVASDAYRGLVGQTNEDGSVTLYATRKGGTAAAGGGELVRIVDTAGYNAPNNGTPVLLATAATNTAFRGVAFTPESSGSNQVPTSNAQSVSTAEDTALPITLGGTDTDGSIASYAIVTVPAHGTLTGTAPNLTYTPDSNYFGADSFTFTVTDNGGATSAAATVSITVTPVNDAPVFEFGTYAFSAVENAPVGRHVGTLVASDVEGDAVSYSITGGNTGNAFQINPTTGVVTVLTPASLGAPGTIFTLTVAASDASASGTATVTIEILDVELFKDGFED